jgi:hypothetical protein
MDTGMKRIYSASMTTKHEMMSKTLLCEIIYLKMYLFINMQVM